jgi:membrane-bound metal-dependent hydrolase YbcI (DUF457 family)
MIGPLMPSPIGHALGGVAAVWSADLVDPGPDASGRLLLLYMALAAAPDLDLLVPGSHRMATHSLFAMLLVFMIAGAVTGQVTRWRTATLCAAAYGSHLLMDWLGADSVPPRGIQLLWPISDRWFISDLDIFRQTARQHFLAPAVIGQNAIAVLQEVAIVAPIVALLWWARRRRALRAQ